MGTFHPLCVSAMDKVREHVSTQTSPTTVQGVSRSLLCWGPWALPGIQKDGLGRGAILPGRNQKGWGLEAPQLTSCVSPVKQAQDNSWEDTSPYLAYPWLYQVIKFVAGVSLTGCEGHRCTCGPPCLVGQWIRREAREAEGPQEAELWGISTMLSLPCSLMLWSSSLSLSKGH